jgi:hypothetical protein
MRISSFIPRGNDGNRRSRPAAKRSSRHRAARFEPLEQRTLLTATPNDPHFLLGGQ